MESRKMDKKVLIIGQNSYIGNSFEKYVENTDFEVQKVSARTNGWQSEVLSQYAAILHVAAIVHQKETPDKQQIYIDVNETLPVEVAKKAKAAGVKQFLFLSTMAVYGEVEGAITKDTPLNPITMYGKTKLAAEQKLAELADENFKIVILRPPMVYGENCPGNYTRLKKLAKVLPVFPNVENKRSMVHVDTLSECIVREIRQNSEQESIEEKEPLAILYPQDKQLVKTTDMYVEMRRSMGKKTYTTKVFNRVIEVLKERIGTVRKLFGSCYYDGVDELV